MRLTTCRRDPDCSGPITSVGSLYVRTRRAGTRLAQLRLCWEAVSPGQVASLIGS
jgi:hypothetical protein